MATLEIVFLIRRKYRTKKNELSALNQAVGKKIASVSLGMSSMTLDGKKLPMINSVSFELENGFLTIFNALDKKGVSNVPANI